MIFYIAFKLVFVLHFICENINWSIFWSAFSAIGTVSAVIVAYWQIKKQIELSNKQHLFDQRLDCYIEGVKTINIFKEKSDILERIKNYDLSTPYRLPWPIFLMLNDDQILFKVATDIEMKIDPVFEERVYKRISDIKQKSVKLKLLFNDGEADDLSITMICFTDLLSALIEYSKIIEIIRQPMNELTNETKDLKTYAEQISEFQEIFNEREVFEKLKLSIQQLTESVKLTDEQYLKDLENKIRLS
ncbi:hypothetical protein [Lactococcus lactis]|uniref:Uncharacterized protein n=1 Tax=Lactococcus lactis subsp. lactis TaxID=1360 RepID=A0AAC9R271_LACLL|nr:hypothetical protein [Lactococcus lactis]ARD97158.1 hypothetical protein LL229_2279 [Lactococcus lactis subsp. lactis]MRK42215.1 hypothetical protein [Lactococcus lactis subsp. lactis]WKF45964.1 hypothetical protein LLUC77_03470 [Lactococcus lactis subsp. lactis]